MRAEVGDHIVTHIFPSTGKRRVDRPIVALSSTTTPSWQGPSTRGAHCVYSEKKQGFEPLLRSTIKLLSSSSSSSHTVTR